MNQNLQRETATIYQFPVGGRAGGQSRRDSQRKIAELKAARIATVDYGSGWYHDAAINEADKFRKS